MLLSIKGNKYNNFYLFKMCDIILCNLWQIHLGKAYTFTQILTRKVKMWQFHRNVIFLHGPQLIIIMFPRNTPYAL